MVTQAAIPPAMADATYATCGISAVYFDKEYTLAATSGMPYGTIGLFSNDDSVGPDLTVNNMTFAIPFEITPSEETSTGVNMVGVFVDGVPAYSNAAPRKVIQGDIASFTVITEGSGYENPTVVIEPAKSAAEATVVDGRVVSVSATSSIIPGIYYDSDPIVRISSGEGASFSLTFDLYGRINSVTVTDGGDYYNDAPVLSVVDDSNRGKGALLTAQVSGGQITGVTIVDPGIDYNPATTGIVPLPIGSGAEVKATVEFYQINRYQEVINNPNWGFDGNSGFLYQNPSEDKDRSTYGYVSAPTGLRNLISDNDEDKHSPILGWALDGSPIYGPYAWKNPKSDVEGVVKMESGYQMESSRATVVPGGGNKNVGSAPPAVGPYDPENNTYPMGSFTQDFVWKEQGTSDAGFDIATENDDDITTEAGLILETDSSVSNTNYLDRYNGRVCNTPEFPNELYPDGVYCYFTTIDSVNDPMFPYIIGETYKNAPVEWYLNWNVQPYPEKIRFGPDPYAPARIYSTHDQRRFRDTGLEDYLKDDLTIEVTGTTSGGINRILVQDGAPDNSMVGDLLYYDDSQVDMDAAGQGGGAVGIVTYLEGKEVTLAGGELLQATLISHRQQLDLSMNNTSYTFVKDTSFRTWNNAVATVESYDHVSKQLIVNVSTLRLISPNEQVDDDGVLLPSFYDNLYKPVRLPTTNPEALTLENAEPGAVIGSSEPGSVTVSYYRPTVRDHGGSDTKPGDLWWSIWDGRMFIYYDDGDSKQWVVTQPLGTVPLKDLSENPYSLASDEALVTGLEFPPDQVLVQGGNNKITISTTAPDQRPDGTGPNRSGDLWWSQETGCLFVWYTDGMQNYISTGVYAETTAQWVITDPAGIAPLGHQNESYSTDQVYPADTPFSTLFGSGLTVDIHSMISEKAPLTREDGSALQFGDIFWSPRSGKLYIYWQDENGTEQWTVCNPSGAITSQYALDFFPGGEVGPGPDIITPSGQIDELDDKRLLWFNELDLFVPGDKVEFQLGSPGVDEQNETALMQSLGTDIRNNALFVRGYNDTPLNLPNGTPMIDTVRALYIVNTDVPHQLKEGEIVIISGSDFPEVNNVHQVVKAGRVVAAEVTPIVDIQSGVVTNLQLVSSGAFYRDNFVISFTGGGGQGAFGFATVEPYSSGGSVISVELLAGGYNYTSSPTPILGSEIDNKTFYIYTNDLHGVDTGDVKYIAQGVNVMGKASNVAVASPGEGYKEIPPAKGLYKKLADRALVAIDLQEQSSTEEEFGTSIQKVTVLEGGARYVAPTVFFYDEQGSGYGAEGFATVEDGVITDITVTEGGQGYRQPALRLVEESGSFMSTTEDIGRITSMTVTSPGRKIVSDSKLNPELQLLTKVILLNPTGDFMYGSQVYQGIVTNKQVTGTVLAWDPAIQELTLEKVKGELRNGEKIYDELGTNGTVIVNGQADARVVINGTTELAGEFINQISILGSQYARIQDSYYYQKFSYNIKSPMQRVQYETFVQDMIHPAGFIMFSELDVTQSVDIDVDVEPMVVSPLVVTATTVELPVLPDK